MTMGGFGGLGGGGGKSATGAKYILDFSVSGNGEAKLHDIVGMFKEMHHSLGEAGESLKQLKVFEGIREGKEFAEKMTEVGLGAMEAGVGIFEVWGKGFETLLEKGGELESMWMRIQTSGKTGAESYKLMKEAVKYSQQLPMTESEVVRVLSGLSLVGVNAMDKMGDSYAKLVQKGQALKDLPTIMGVKELADKGPTAVSLIADAMAKAGVDASYRTRAIHEFMEWIETGVSGALRSQAMAPLAAQLKEVAHGAKTGAERLKALYTVLSNSHAIGAAAAQTNTWAGVMTKFQGIMDLITMSVMEPGKPGGLLSQLTKGFKGLYDTLTEFFDENTPKGKEFLGMLREVGTMVAGYLIRGLEMLGAVIKKVFDFMSTHVGLMKFLAVGSLIVGLALILGGAVVVLAGTFLGLSLAVMGAVASFMALETALAPVFIGIGLVAALFAVVFVEALLAAVAAYEAFEHNFAGVKTLFEDIGIVISAVSEAFDTWNNGVFQLSEETANKLQQGGLIGIFMRITHWIREAEALWQGFSGRISEQWDAMSARFGAAFQKISDAFKEVIQAVFDFQLAVTSGQAGVDDMTATGQNFGDIMVDVLNYVVAGVEALADAVVWVKDIFLELKGNAGAQAVFFLIAEGAHTAWSAVTHLAEALERAMGYLHFMSKIPGLGALDPYAGRGENGEVLAPQGPVEGRHRGGAAGSGSEDMIGKPTPYRGRTGEHATGDEGEGTHGNAGAGGGGKGAGGGPVQLHQTLKGDVHLDGQKVADVVWKKVQENLERDGYHPTEP